MLKLLRAVASAAVVVSVFSCGQELPVETQLFISPEPSLDSGVDGGVSEGVSDAGLHAGAPDAGEAQPDAGADAGVISCGTGLLGNGGFECQQEGWVVPEGTAALISPGQEGLFALSVATDAQGRARVAAAPLPMQSATTLCLAVLARGTVANVRLEAWVSPSNRLVTFTAPVSAAWSRVPPSRLAVPVPAGSMVNVMARAIGGKPGQLLELDGFEATPCSP